MATEISDLNIIQDEDTLRRMWQDTEDFSRKKEIRLRMYRLREERLKSYYVTRETVTDSAVTSHKPASSSHAVSLSDQGFLTMKTKEIRDSASPTLDLRHSNISSLSTSSQSEQLANQNIVTTSRQTVEKRSFNSSGSTSNQCNKDQSGSTIITYETSAVPYSKSNSQIISYDGQDLHNNDGKSIKSIQSNATEKYCTSSRREAVSSSAITENKQQKVISNNYSTIVTQNTNNHNIIPDNTNYKVEFVNQKTNEQNIGHFADNALHHSQESIEYRDTNTSNLRIPASLKISTSKHSNQEYNSSKSSHMPSVIQENVFIENTVCGNNHDTKTANKSSETKCVTNKTISQTQNVNNNIMNELQKLDTYLSNEAVTNSLIPSSPASNCINEIQVVDRNIKSVTSKQIEPTEPTDHTTTYQQAYSKISVENSATHNAFASSLRASPDRSIISPGKRTPSKSSLDRSTPDKSPRTSPEKSSCNDLSRKYTASFQSRISRDSNHTRDSKSSSPTKYKEPKYKQRSTSSSSETDSDDSSATYNTKVIESTTSKRTNSNNKSIKTECTHSSKNINKKFVQQNRYISPTKSSGHTSEGSVEREIGKFITKSPDSSPERSAFKPVTLNNHGKSIVTEERVYTLNKKQDSTLKKSSPDIYPVESCNKKQSPSPNFQKQSSPPITSPNHQRKSTDLTNQQKLQKQPAPKLSTKTYNSSAKTIQNSSTENQIQPSQTLISAPAEKPQSTTKRQSSPQIISNNTCFVENIVNRNQIEIKRQSSPQINISTENIYKPEPRRHPSLQTVISSNDAENNERLHREEIEIKEKLIVGDKPVKRSKPISQQETMDAVNIQVTSVMHDNRGPLKPKRQPQKQIISTTLSSQISDVNNQNIQERTTHSSTLKNDSVLMEPICTKTTAPIDDLLETEQKTHSNKSTSKKKSFKNQRMSPEKTSKPNTNIIESIDVNVIRHDKSSLDTKQKNINEKKIKNSSIIDGKIIDVDEGDFVEEIKVKTTPTNAELHLKNSKAKIIHTNQETNDIIEDEVIKVSIPKQRSASYNEFSTPRKKESVSNKVITNESTDESSSSSESSSEDEREEVVIEEIFDEFGTPIPREINPLDAALKLEAAIKSKEEVEREKQAIANVPLIPEDRVNNRTINESEAFIKQEKLIQEGDEDDCLPPVEQVLGKDVNKAALNDFLEWERKQNIHKHTHSTDTKDNTQNKFTTAEKYTPKLEMKQKAVEPVQSTVEKDKKYIKKQQKLESIDKVKTAEKNKPHIEKKIVSKSVSNKKLIKEDIQTIPQLKSPSKKYNESVSGPLSKSMIKQSSTKDMVQTKKSATITPKITKQLSDRSLKEKNDKLLIRKLDHQHKTKSETIIKPTKPSNIFQRRVTDQVQSNTLHKNDTNNSFNKENREISKSTKIVSKELPQKDCKTVKDTIVLKTHISKHADKPTSKKTVPMKKISPTSHKISPTNVLFQTNKSTKDKVIVTRESMMKPIKRKPKSSSQTLDIENVKLKNKKSKEHIVSESSSSTSSVENLHVESTTYDTSKSQVHQEELIECSDERVQKRNELEQKFPTSVIESKDNHLNVVIRMPSSSRETTPNKQTEDRFYPVTDDNGEVPRYADRVTSPDNVEVLIKKNSTNLSTFEKITDLDEEDEISDTDLANASVAERRTKFLENVKETTTAKQMTIVEDDLFQNRELDVSKTKEMFETIAKNQVPGNNTPIVKPPIIINRPSVFETSTTIVEPGHDGSHHVVSKKLSEQDYEDYIHECEDATRVNITKITKSFEDKAAKNSKHVINTKPKYSEIKITSPSREKPCKEISSEPVNPNIESTQSNVSKIIYVEYENTEQPSSLSSSCTSPVPGGKTTSKRFFSPPVISKTQPPIKEHSRSPSISPIREINICNKPKKDTVKPNSSPLKEQSNKQLSHPNKPILVQDRSDSFHFNHPTSSEIKHTTNTTSKKDSKGAIIESTTHRYEVNRKSPTKNTVLQQPIEITQVEVRPSRQVYEHTAITNVQNISSKFTPVEETFNQKLTRYSEENNKNSTLTKPTESSKRRTSKSPSPEKAPLALSSTSQKSYSPPKDVTRKSISNIDNSPIISTLKRQKSPSPEKVTSKLRSKFTTNVDAVGIKKKKFEKRLSTTGSDYQNRKQFFETNTAQNKSKQNHPGTVIANKYEITVKSTSRNEKPNMFSGNNSSKAEKSPTRRSPSKSPERIYKPKIESTRKVIKERRISPTKTIITTTTTTTTIEPKRFILSPANAKRISPEKIVKKEPFGVTLRKTKTPSSTISTSSVKHVQRNEMDYIVEEIFANGKKIEEIFNLELLERMSTKMMHPAEFGCPTSTYKDKSISKVLYGSLSATNISVMPSLENILQQLFP